MRIETIIADTNHAPEKWYTVTTHEHDNKIKTISKPSFAAALEYAIRECNTIEGDAFRLEQEPDYLFADDLRHSFPVLITVVGDYHNVLFQLSESEE